MNLCNFNTGELRFFSKAALNPSRLMAIRDGENSSAPSQSRRPRQKRLLAAKPGLFFRTVIPSGAVKASISCSLTPTHDFLRYPNDDKPARLRTAQHLVFASASRIVAHTLDPSTETLRELASLNLFAAVRDVSAMPSPVQGRDILVVLTERNRVAFVQFDEREARLRVAGHVEVLTFTRLIRESRIVATHPHKKICAVASLSSTVVVFPVLFLRQDISAGKIVNVDVDGIILGMDFLEDDGCQSDSVLLVLVQRSSEQWIALYTIGAQQGTSGGGLSVTQVGAMITGSERPDESAIARHAAKLGTELRAPSQAHGLTRISRAPYLFAVLLEGRVIAADARPILEGSVEAQESLPLAIRVRSDISRNANLNVDDMSDHCATGRVPKSLRIISGFGRTDRPAAQRRGLATALGESATTDPYLSYFYVPSCVSLNLGSNEGSPTSWSSANDHFQISHSGYHDDGIYIVMETGALFVLRWTLLPRKGTFAIPIEESGMKSPRPNFSVEYAGHVGPCVSISALDDQLLYIANDGTDGSLRRVELPKIASAPATDSRWATAGWLKSESLLATSGVSSAGYGLEVRQEFLNLSPVSDFVIIPPGGVQTLTNSKLVRCLSRAHNRGRGSLTPASASPNYQPRKGPRQIRGPSTPYSTRSEPDPVFPDRRSQRRGEHPHSPASPDHLNHALRTISPKSKPSHFSEPEIVLCCGLHKSGTLRVVKPGAPVTVFASSSNSFQGCNDIWSVRLSSQAKLDTLIALSFSQATRILYSVPPYAVRDDVNLSSSVNDTISHLLDASASSKILEDTRSLIVGRLEDGLIAQVHPYGVRTILFSKKSELQLPLLTENGQLLTPLAKHFWDWAIPDGHVISTAAVGGGYVFLGVARSGCRSPRLIVLKQSLIDESCEKLTVVSSAELSAELSCISLLPSADSQSDSLSARQMARPVPVLIVGTYTPSIEVWTLNPRLKCIVVKSLKPWCAASPGSILAQAKSEDENSMNVEVDSRVWQEGAVSGSGNSTGPSERESNGQDANSGLPHFMKSWTLEKVLDAFVMTGVPESLCAFEIYGNYTLLAGLRNGNVLRFTLGGVNKDEDFTSREEGCFLKLISRRRIGDIPVKLFRVFISSGIAVIAQAERPWIASVEGVDIEWMPLSFPETRSWCCFSAPGADRCLATVSADDVFHICGLRRLTPVSVHSILVGDTPRRVVALSSPVDSLLVATCREVPPKSDRHDFDSSDVRAWNRKDNSYSTLPFSELKVFHKYSKKYMGGTQLNTGELVHVLLRWCDLIVVGTSIRIRSTKGTGFTGDCRDGRLLLYSVRSLGANGTASRLANQSRGRRAEKVAIDLCSEVVMHGAVLAGSVHSNQDMLVISCNDTVYVFGMSKSAFFEVTRVSTRSLVVSISMRGPLICVADRKDSVGFFRLDYEHVSLVRDRTDHRYRVVSDTVVADCRTVFAADKFGSFISIAYNALEEPPATEDEDDNSSSVISLVPEALFNKISTANPDDVIAPANVSSFGDSMNDAGSDSMVMQDENSEYGTDSQAYFSDTPADSNDGTIVEGLLSVGTAGNSTMNDDYSEDIEVEGASINETAGTTDGHNEVDLDDDEPTDDGGVVIQGLQMDTADAMTGIAVADEEVIDIGNVNDLVPPGTHGPGTPPADAFHTLLSAQARRDDKLPVQRTLVSNHSFNMRDAALTIRKGIFKRSETIEAHDVHRVRHRSKYSFWTDAESGIFAATLGGALLSTIPICGDTVALLSEITDAMVSHTGVAKSLLLTNYKRFRAAHGPQSEGVVDGDLLQLFLQLTPQEQREVCTSVGLTEEDSGMQIEGLILELCRRVG